MKLQDVLLVSVFIATVNGFYLCGRNQYWNTCASYCLSEPTCANPLGGPIAPGAVCQGLCVEKCSCLDGYVLHNGQCISPLECPPTYWEGANPCGVGGFFDQCTSACKPVPTCADPFPAPLPPGSLCVAECVPSCSCNPGYVLQNGICIEWSLC